MRTAMMIEPRSNITQRQNQTPETIRQSGLQISDDLRQLCAQLAEDNQTLQQELDQIARTACEVFETVANRIQAQQDNWLNVREILGKYRTALTQTTSATGSLEAPRGAVARALDDQLQSMSPPRERIRAGGPIL